MNENTIRLIKKVRKLSKQEKFDEILALLKDVVLEKILEKDKAADLYIWRGNAWYFKQDKDKATTYDRAIKDYKKAIEINPNYTLAFYNIAHAWGAKKDYTNAIAYFDIVIGLDSKYENVYVSRGNIKRVFNEDYDGAIDDYTTAIRENSKDENAIYYRSFAYYKKALKKSEFNINLLEKSKKYFEDYLKVVPDENESGAKYARRYIEELDEVIKDPNLWNIKQLINRIKDILWLGKDDFITHYTSLSVLKDLIFDCSKFRISEGNFMNDPSEGKEFFKYLKFKPNTIHKTSSFNESFLPKPFIGSFVPEKKSNNLNMWRFYGKEKGEEAKGCSITLPKQKFIDYIKDSLLNEKNKEARLDDESDLNFYRVAYIAHNGAAKFLIPNREKSKKLEILMKELTKKVEPYKKQDNRALLERYLNNIAFLFKNDAYKNEDEVRLVMNGIEFEKKYNIGVNSPRVYIELVSVKDIVSQIMLGPKVDKVSEWKTAFRYCYQQESEAPKIDISRVPFK